jgi:hypothetical protein
VQAGQWLTAAQARQGVAGVTGMPSVCWSCRQFTLSRCGVRQKDRAGSIVAALAKIAQA